MSMSFENEDIKKCLWNCVFAIISKKDLDVTGFWSAAELEEDNEDNDFSAVEPDMAVRKKVFTEVIEDPELPAYFSVISKRDLGVDLSLHFSRIFAEVKNEIENISV